MQCLHELHLSLKCLFWLALIIWCSALWIKTMSSWFLSQWTFLFGSSFCVGFPLLQDSSNFFLYSNTDPTISFNLAQPETRLLLLAKTPSTIWISLLFASFFNSASSFNDPMLQSLLGQSASTCQKNDGSWKQRLLHVSFHQQDLLCLRHSSVLINPCIFFNLMDTVSNKHFESFRIAPNLCENYLAIISKSLLQIIYLQLFP